MKIIYLHQYFNTPEMSGGTRSYEMARRMVAAGHEVHMVTSIRESSSNHTDWFLTDEAGIHVHWYPVPYSNNMSYAQRIRAFLSFAFAARKKAVQLEGDVIFATSTPLTIALPAVPAARKKKIPMVFEVRDLWPEMPIAVGALNNPVLRFAARKLENWAYKNASAVVALSPGMKEGVVRTGYPKQKVAVIPNSSDNAEFAYNPDAAKSFRAQRSWLGDKPLLVYTGTFGKINGVGYMVDLALALKKLGSDICILLVGQGAERDLVVEKAQEQGVYEYNLFIENPLPKKDIPALLSAATMATALFIDLPEMRPNSANKFFDALASGTPVFINYGGWMHDLIAANDCGLPMWQKPINEVAEILHAKMHDQNWLEASGSSARKLAENSFARDDLANQLNKLLELAVEGKSELAASIAPGIYCK
ncbi:MAG: glycosyltransferase family 4 protein [Marinospirillum sp.]|uniref:glycosyltransferase family 4 protein n=1 Tax=Marinospirillum sp. TaxID=2183934 RepID=UPI0019ED2119|nr:glycosyltransferase family 4 protein [Marinospirillum sp.]MBE0508157.1 glycosyltransferase family 4 protein [Marinospirillum sp.]